MATSSLAQVTNTSNFGVYYNFDGHFMKIGGQMLYFKGDIKYNDGFNIDKVKYMDFEDDIKKLGYSKFKLYYKVPSMQLTAEFKELQKDSDVLEMLQCIGKKGWGGFFRLYVEGERTVLTEGEGIVLTEGEETVLTEGERIVLTEDTEIHVMAENARDKNVVNVNIEVHREVVSDYYDSEMDSDYFPIGESDTDDGLEDNELSDDEEYIQAREERAKYKRVTTEVLEVNSVGGNERSTCFNSPPNESHDVVDIADPESGYKSDYDDSDGDMDSISSDDELGESRIEKKKRKVVYDPKSDPKDFKLKLGMRFENAPQCKEAMRKWAIINGYNIQTLRTNFFQLEMRCESGCPWNFFGSTLKQEETFSIRRLVSEHLCARKIENRQATYVWIANEYINRFRRDPNWSADGLQNELLEKYCLKVSKWKCYRSKWRALELLRGTVFEHYAMLRSYKAELMRVDREGRFDILLGDDSVFKGFFVGLSALKEGFLRGCRPIIGFDGCFLKTFLGGALLTAVAKDGNNQMFPICWAVVESENEHYWTWFLKIMCEELGIKEGYGWSFMSDQQKGLINAIKNLTPHAEHRNCARHVYCNWKKQFKGQTLKKLFWKAARSTYKAELEASLTKIKTENVAAYNDFIERDPKKFCKLYMSHVPMSDMIDNNVCETFNGYIVKEMPGRPKKKRARAAEEEKRGKLTKHGVQMTCTICGGVGHNKRSCKEKYNAAAHKPAKQPGKRGRPRKAPVSVAANVVGPSTSSASVVPILVHPSTSKRVKRREQRLAPQSNASAREINQSQAS